jgi:hypothetical protein
MLKFKKIIREGKIQRLVVLGSRFLQAGPLVEQVFDNWLHMSAPFLQKDSIKCSEKSHYVRGSLSLENYNKSPIFVFQTSSFHFYCRSGFWKINKLSTWKGTSYHKFDPYKRRRKITVSEC